MIDIDFRYVMRPIPAPELGEGICRSAPVLQWRKKVYMPVLNQPVLPLYMPDPEWTDWQDVRTEEE